MNGCLCQRVEPLIRPAAGHSEVLGPRGGYILFLPTANRGAADDRRRVAGGSGLSPAELVDPSSSRGGCSERCPLGLNEPGGAPLQNKPRRPEGLVMSKERN